MKQHFIPRRMAKRQTTPNTSKSVEQLKYTLLSVAENVATVLENHLPLVKN